MPHLWYHIRTPEQRRAALDEVISLRVDPHIRTLNASPLLAAIRDHREVGGIDVSYQPGHDQPTFMTVGSTTRPLSLNDTFPLGALSQSFIQTDPETVRQVIEHYFQQSQESQEVGRNRPFHSDFGSNLGSMALPLRRNIDYTSVVRQTFLVDPLPEGALPSYEPSTPPMPQWPEWCHEGVTVYFREEDYRPMIVTKVEDTVTVRGETEEDEFYVFYPRDLAELVSPVRPPNRWELLLDED